MPTFKKIMPVPRVGGDGGGDRLVHPIAGLRRVLAVSKRQRGQKLHASGGGNQSNAFNGFAIGREARAFSGTQYFETVGVGALHADLRMKLRSRGRWKRWSMERSSLAFGTGMGTLWLSLNMWSCPV